ncbi:MAG: hypothetical protein PVH88_06365 [Ignavibacteria bacterium]|jgi:hypothetical protein
MNTLIRSTLLFFTITAKLLSQDIWSYSPNPFTDSFIKDSRSDSLHVLREVITNDSVGASSVEYSIAVEYLYLYHKDTESQFLLENLNTIIDTAISPTKLQSQWAKFYIDKFFLGLLGNLTAITGMDSVARYSTDTYVKSKAIYDLAEIGIFEFYDYVKDSYINKENNITLGHLVTYGYYNSIYKEEVIYIIENELRALDDDHIQVRELIRSISYLDKQYALSLLDEYFRKTVGKVRRTYFDELYFYDEHGQPERTMYVLPIETDPYLQGRYIQNPRHIQKAKRSNHYLEPKFINFLINVELTNNDVHLRRLSYLRAYKPFKPDSTVSETEMIDSLISYNHQSYSFGWIPDTLTYDTLSLRLASIEVDIDTQLWTDALNKTNDYLQYVENALSQNAINDDAYKFLRYYGEYIKERLDYLVQ